MRGTASLKAIAISLAMSSGQVTKAVTTAERQGCEGYIVISLAFSLAAAAAWATLTVSKKNSSAMVDGFGCCIAPPVCEVYGASVKQHCRSFACQVTDSGVPIVSNLCVRLSGVVDAWLAGRD